MITKPIVWADSMSIGVPELDAAHKHLIDLVNGLFVAGHGALPSQSLEEAVRLLLSHTLAHFAHEEAYLHSRNIPASNRHQAEHIRLYAELEAICQRLLKEGGRELDSATAAFLRHWMVSHIMAHDKRDSAILSKAS